MNSMVVGAALIASVTPARAQTPFSSAKVRALELGESIGVVDQIVSVPFESTRAYVLMERGLGQVHRYPALVRKTGQVGVSASGQEEVLVGAKVPLDSLGSVRHAFSVVFFLMDEGNAFAATPVDRWTRDMLRENTRSPDDLSKDVEKLGRQVQTKTQELAAIDEKFKGLRSQASSVAGIDEIIDSKMELEHLKGLGQDSKAEMSRLRELIDLSRSTENSIELDERRRELSVHLTEAAQATAMADRLTGRQRDAALASIQKKLNAIRAAKGLNPDLLAQEVVKLRSRRQALEAKLNLGGGEPSNEF